MAGKKYQMPHSVIFLEFTKSECMKLAFNRKEDSDEVSIYYAGNLNDYQFGE